MKNLRIYAVWFNTQKHLRMGVLIFALLMSTLFGATTPLTSVDQTTVKAESISKVTPSSEKKVATKASKNVKKEVSTTNTQSASHTTTTNVSSTTSTRSVTPTQPTTVYNKVSIPSIGLTSQFVTVGLTSGNAIDVHPSLVGWWNGSAQPGNKGAVFLDGHNPGVFSNLPNITIGSKITINMASGKSYSYSVVYREIVKLEKVDMVKALKPYGGASEGLNIITCMGTYNPATGTTDKRLIVYAVRS